jgi:Protein tyrosine and serine/threonine kinase
MTEAYKGVKPVEIRDSIREGQRLTINHEIAEELKSLVAKSWNQNPRARPTFAGIVTFLKAFLIVDPNIESEAFDPDKDLMKSFKMPPSSVNQPQDSVIKTTNMSVRPKVSWSQYATKNKLKLIIFGFSIFLLATSGVVVGLLITENKSQSSVDSKTSTSSSDRSFSTTMTQASIAPATTPSTTLFIKSRTSIPISTNSVVNVSTLVKVNYLYRIFVRDH